MESRYFWTAELTKGNPECTWPADTPDDEAIEDAVHLLEVERGVLGVSAKANDLNVVTVATLSSDGETSSAAPILRLKVGGKEQCRIGLQFSSKATFKLVSGNGPVHIMGLHETVYEDEDEDDFDSDDEDLSDLGLGVARPEAKKRSANGGGLPPAKKQQRGMSAPGDDDDDDTDDSEEMSDEELDMMKGGSVRAVLGADDLDDDDSDDDDFDMDDDEDDDDDEEDDEEDDSEEDDSEGESPVKAPVTKGKPQQRPQGNNQQQKSQPQQQKGQKQQPKNQQQQQQKGKPQAQQQGQQQKGGKPQTPQKEAMTMEQMKKKLSTSPSLPKKQEKFRNFVKNTYKCSDEKAINELWNYVQKSRK